MYKLRLNPTKKISYKSIDMGNFRNGINTTIDDYSTPITYSKNAYNFEYKNGALSTGLGIVNPKVSMTKNGLNYKDLVVPEGIDVLAVWTFDRYVENVNQTETHIIIYCSDKCLYMVDVTTGIASFRRIIPEKTFETVPTAIKYKVDGYDCMIFTTPTDGLYIYTPTEYQKDTTNCPPITSMCMHYERLFATVDGEKISLWFSDDLDPTNWNVSSTEAGFINMIDARGQLNKVISFKDYLYVFREYGISKITAYGRQEEFNVAQLFLSSTKIYEKTVCECGDSILMLLDDGIYAFDGINAERLNLNIENIIKADTNAVATYFNGKYYLSCRIDFPDDDIVGCESENYINNAVIIVDIANGSFSIMRGVDIVYLHGAKDHCFSELFCCYRSQGSTKLGLIKNTGCVLEDPCQKVWHSPVTDFDSPGQYKIIKEIYFNCNQDTIVEVCSEKEKRTFNVSPIHSMVRLYVNMVGKEFSISFKVNTADAYISNPKIILGV